MCDYINTLNMENKILLFKNIQIIILKTLYQLSYYII